MKKTSIITLTTDFGLKDSYVAEMKAVVLNVHPSATIVDITHQIPPFNIRIGAYVLSSAAPFFPKGTIHVVVVDPGVGTTRKAILIQTRKEYFIGPDNGILYLAAKTRGIEHVYQIKNPTLRRKTISKTFHGRDIFAPAAAHLAKGVSPTDFGPEICGIVVPKFAKVVKKVNVLIAEVLHVDRFGNIITNCTKEDLESVGIDMRFFLKLKLRKETLLRLCKTYAALPSQQLLAIIGSHNFLEISMNKGDAAEMLDVKVGERLTLKRC